LLLQDAEWGFPLLGAEYTQSFLAQGEVALLGAEWDLKLLLLREQSGGLFCLVQMKPRAFCSRGRLLCWVQSWASALTAAWSRVVPSPLSGLVHTDLQVEYTGVLTLTVLEDLQKLCRLHCSSPIDGFYRKSTQGCTYPNRLADLQKEYIEYFPHRIKDLQEKCTRAMHFPSPVLANSVII